MNNSLDNKLTDPPVTITIIRRVKPGCEAAYEKLATQLSLEANKFPGHLGTNLFKPANPHDNDYRIIYKFDCMSHFHQWQHSEIRKAITDEINKLLIAPEHMQILTGLETWFSLPNQGVLIPPPRYKMAIVSWLAIYPLVIIILEVLAPILQNLPIPLRAGLITLIAIPTMTYILMPRMTKLFSHWLYPEVTEHITTAEEHIKK
jgi:hypothetical protein